MHESETGHGRIVVDDHLEGIEVEFILRED